MSVCAILLSYKRPQNMDRILRQTAEVAEISRIVLSNNNPEINIFDWIDPTAYPVEVIQQERRCLYTKRFDIASRLDHDYFFCPDDDVFLSPQQISFLIDKLKRDPAVPHGMAGQIKTFSLTGVELQSGVVDIDCEVEILNRSYFFTRQHVQRMLELMRAVGLPSLEEARFMDDVLLSFSGNGLPRCHAIGPVADCETSHTPGIATWKEDGFYEFRLRELIRLTGIVGEAMRRPCSPAMNPVLAKG